jgi:hypothetical protein
MFWLRSASFGIETPQKLELCHMKPKIAKVGVVGSNPIARSSFLIAQSMA